jgi:peptidylprolyl isomerase
LCTNNKEQRKSLALNTTEAPMNQVKSGDKVKVHINVFLENGINFLRSKDDEPFEFTIGQGEVIPGFENAVIGMEVGEEKTVKIPPEEAFGERKDELVVDVNRSDIPEDITPSIGEQLQIRLYGSDPIKATVVDMSEDTVTLDGNHPLAGYTLTYNILLVAIQ